MNSFIHRGCHAIAYSLRGSIQENRNARTKLVRHMLCRPNKVAAAISFLMNDGKADNQLMNFAWGQFPIS